MTDNEKLPTEFERVIVAEALKAVREAGVDPHKITVVKIFPPMLKKYCTGEWTKGRFQKSCRNVAILNGWIMLV